MKKRTVVLLCGLGLTAMAQNAMAVDLLQVFQQALQSDETFQASVAQIQANKEGVPIARSYLLPQVSGIANGQRIFLSSRAGTPIPNSNLEFGVGHYAYNLGEYQVSLSQSVFDYALWAGLSQAKYISKASDAQYNASLQDLMTRTATAYFNVLSAEDNLRYVEAEKKAVFQQLDQARQQYKVGVIPITNVYQAQAEYDSLLSQEISAQNNLINQRENLRVITNVYYDDLASLKNKLPLVMPSPANPETWVQTAIAQNWSLISQRFTVAASQANVSIQRAGHLPTLTALATNTGINQHDEGPSGRQDTTENAIGLQLNLPIFQGGLVTSETKQAKYQYQNALANMEQTYRNVVDDTHTSYNDVVSGINQVRADMQSILSNASSLRSTIEGYKVGTQTMLDVLQAQENLYLAEQQYSTDQYNYINATIALKQAAGTLSLNDLQLINTWLSQRKDQSYSSLNINSIQQQAEKNYQETVKANADLGITPMQGNDVIKEINKMNASPDDNSMPQALPANSPAPIPASVNSPVSNAQGT